MQEEVKTLRIGEKVPDFELDAYFPDKKDFGKVRFTDITKSGKWIVKPL